MPVLPQEDPDQVHERTQQWIDDLQPRNTVEQELAAQAAGLTIDLERAQRISLGHMARRVMLAARRRGRKISPQERQRLHELGSKLLYIRGPEPLKADQKPGEDDPGLMVAELEDTAAGCRWLLDRFAEYQRLLEGRTHWEKATLLRFVQLLGKRVVEAVYDPVLNSILVAWDVLVPHSAQESWERFCQSRSTPDPSYNRSQQWREITPRPKDESEAWGVLEVILNQQVVRLQERLAEHDINDAAMADDPTWMDRAAMDCSPEFERHRRSQSARTRELHRTLEIFLKVRKAGGEGMADGKEGMTDGKGQMTNGKEEMADGTGEMTDGNGEIADGTGGMTDGMGEMTDGKDGMTDGTGEMADGTWQMAHDERQMTDGDGQMTDDESGEGQEAEAEDEDPGTNGECQNDEDSIEPVAEAAMTLEKVTNEATKELAQVSEDHASAPRKMRSASARTNPRCGGRGGSGQGGWRAGRDGGRERSRGPRR